MIILAADTGTSINTVAVCDGDRLLAETIVETGRAHSEKLLLTVDWVLDEAGLTLDKVEMLAIGIGPGSFTGLRVGAATWKGLAFARNLPLVAVPSLDAMTRLAPFYNEVVCPLLDARMHEVFGAVYRFSNGRREKLVADSVCPVDTILDLIPAPDPIFLGNGATLYGDRILARIPRARFAPALCSVPRASAVAAEAIALAGAGISTDAAAVSPVYLRKSQPEEKKPQSEVNP
ncbi:MAG: tRNA (adenosine(37)-N6)-threonylcarbamoyltransferase complex dimerization subunit type 1 TsaB [Candidatus Hydrogenedentes bacterium]|nr:tRNA (adenosine(37)-N6)-threonylcarbamoyltransferase complex dimerization subunit type 1 TsaB [Candidatus Hydrogenedentota bacterium]